MISNIADLAEISELLGLARSEEKVLQFLGRLTGRNPVITTDNSDGANDEYIEFKEYGYCLYFDGGVLDSIFLHSAEENSDYLEFGLHLPMLLHFSMSKKKVIDLCGLPKAEGGGADPFWGEISSWVKFDLESYIMHVEFNKGLDSIRLITLSK
jgi:hypothetical protein